MVTLYIHQSFDSLLKRLDLLKPRFVRAILSTECEEYRSETNQKAQALIRLMIEEQSRISVKNTENHLETTKVQRWATRNLANLTFRKRAQSLRDAAKAHESQRKMRRLVSSAKQDIQTAQLKLERMTQ